MPSRPAAVLYYQNQHRALFVCVAISILLHTGALFLFPGLRQKPTESSGPKILTAVLSPRLAVPDPPVVQEAVPESKPEVRPPEPPKPKQEPRPEPQRTPITRPTPSPTAPVLPAPSIATPTAPSPPVEAAPAAPTPPPPPVTSAAKAAEPQAPPPGALAPAGPKAPIDAPDTGTLDQYRISLITAARRYKRYPAQALERGWQGKVEIRLVIGANGMIQTATVKTSSGHQLLDDTAMDMVKKGKPLTQIPGSLRGREFIIDIPVIFDLQAG